MRVSKACKVMLDVLVLVPVPVAGVAALLAACKSVSRWANALCNSAGALPWLAREISAYRPDAKPPRGLPYPAPPKGLVAVLMGGVLGALVGVLAAGVLADAALAAPAAGVVVPAVAGWLAPLIAWNRACMK
jgi:hypothetical protein